MISLRRSYVMQPVASFPRRGKDVKPVASATGRDAVILCPFRADPIFPCVPGVETPGYTTEPLSGF